MPTFANVLMYTIATVKIPRPMFEYFIKFAKPYRESAHIYRPLIVFLRGVYMVKRGLYHLRWKDFSIVFGRFGWYLWRVGYLKSTLKHPNGFIKAAETNR